MIHVRYDEKWKSLSVGMFDIQYDSSDDMWFIYVCGDGQVSSANTEGEAIKWCINEIKRIINRGKQNSNRKNA